MRCVTTLGVFGEKLSDWIVIVAVWMLNSLIFLNHYQYVIYQKNWKKTNAHTNSRTFTTRHAHIDLYLSIDIHVWKVGTMEIDLEATNTRQNLKYAYACFLRFKWEWTCKTIINIQRLSEDLQKYF